MRVFSLYWMTLAAMWHRIRYDLGREITTALASVILCATFFYVFNDFINVQVASLSVAMRDRFAHVAAYAVLLAAAAATARLARVERLAQHGVRQMAEALGESKWVVIALRILTLVSLVAAVHGAAWYVSRRWLTVLTFTATLGWEIAMLAITIAVAYLPRPSASTHPLAAPREVTSKLTPTAMLVHWRFLQMLRRNRLTRLLLLVAILFLGLVGWAALTDAPSFIATIAGLVAGYFGAAMLPFQLAEDLANAWIERGLGVTHDQFVAAYDRLGRFIGAGVGLSAGSIYLALHAARFGYSAALLPDAAKLAVVTAVPPVTAALFLFQIDGRRPAINLTLALITSLFLGTAVYASWFALLLLPILRYYALGIQSRRFYRA